MIKHALMGGLILLAVSAPVRVTAAEPVAPEKAPSGQVELPDKTKQDACDCCQKCKAARRPANQKEEGGPAETNGCEDCCLRCGNPAPPAPGEFPPEVIEKQKR